MKSHYNRLLTITISRPSCHGMADNNVDCDGDSLGTGGHSTEKITGRVVSMIGE